MKSTAESALGGEFASVMQKLSAEAERGLSPAEAGAAATDLQLGSILAEFRALNERIDQLEAAVAASAERGSVEAELAPRFERMDAQMSALRATEATNQRLFDSLHDELIKYRDNFLHESLQKPFIRDLVVLFDDLSTVAAQVSSAAAERGGIVTQWRDNLENGIHSLLEILHRMEVNEVEPKEMVDRAIHKVVSYEPADFPEDDGRIVLRLKRGFMWRDRVLRAEEVVAKRLQ